MILGALLGLGVDFPAFSAQLEALLPGHFRLEFGPCISGGIAGVRAKVLFPEEEHCHHGSGEGHCHDHDSGEGHHHGHDHHHYREIRQLIEKSSLPERVRSRSLAAFSLLAEAERLGYAGAGGGSQRIGNHRIHSSRTAPARGVWQRHLHPLFGKRHRAGMCQRRLSGCIAAHAEWAFHSW